MACLKIMLIGEVQAMFDSAPPSWVLPDLKDKFLTWWDQVNGISELIK